MRMGAIFARGSCRALKWMALLGMLVVLGGVHAAAQNGPRPNFPDPSISNGNYHAVVDDTGTDTIVLIPMSAGNVAVTSIGAPARTILQAFSITGTYQITAVAPADWEATDDNQLVQVTLDRSISVGDVPVLTYTYPGIAHNRLQGGPASADVPTFSVNVHPARPELPVSPTLGRHFLDLKGRSFTIHTGAAVNWLLPRVDKGGFLNIEYSAEGDTAGDGNNAQTGFTCAPASTVCTGTNSGLTFHEASRSIVGRARDVGTYRVTYKALSADGVDGATAPAADDIPFGAGESTQWFDEKFIDIVVTASDTNGVIEKITVGAKGANGPLKTLGGVERVHLDEGGNTDVTVHVKWSHAQLQALSGATASVDLEVRAHHDNPAWLSPAETSERPDGGYGVGDDAVLASDTVSISIPTPKTNVGSPSHYMTGKGTVRLSVPTDADAEDEAFKIHVVDLTGVNVLTTAPSRLENDHPVLVDDAQTQKIKLSRSPTGAVLEGTPVTFTVKPDPARVDLDLDVRYSVDTVGTASVSSGTYTLSASSGTIPAAATPQQHTTTFSTPTNDKNRLDETFEVSAEVVSFDLSSGAYTHIAKVSNNVEVLDKHKLPLLDATTVSPKDGKVKEGESLKIKMAIDRNPARTRRLDGDALDVSQEAINVMFSMGAGSSVGASDYRITTNPVPVAERKSTATSWIQELEVEVMALADNDLDDMEVLVLDAVVDGTKNAEYGDNTDDDMYRGVAMLTIEEGTAKLVYAKTQAEVEAAIDAAKTAGMGADDMFTAGEMIKVMGSALFGAGEGVTLSYSAETSDAKVASSMVSGGEVTVTAVGMGDAMITITAHASMPSGVTINQQTDTREASITIPISVALEPLTITLEGPDAGMNLVEGMEYTLTAKANRAVEMDTMVELMQTGGTASPADYEVAGITIKMGESMGTTKLMVKEDDMDEHGAGMEESLTLEGRVGTMKTNALTFYLWDAAVPALPVIAQLLLAAFLAVGGYRRYRRR